MATQAGRNAHARACTPVASLRIRISSGAFTAAELRDRAGLRGVPAASSSVLVTIACCTLRGAP